MSVTSGNTIISNFAIHNMSLEGALALPKGRTGIANDASFSRETDMCLVVCNCTGGLW